MPLSSKELAPLLAGEIGPDLAYVRKEEDRLFLTGIEVGILVGTGVIASFCIGFFNGVKKGVAKHAEQLGETLVDSLVEKLRKALGQLPLPGNTRSEDAARQISDCQSVIDEVVSDPRLSDRVADPALIAMEVTEVAVYLRQIGFPDDEVDERSRILVARIHREWRSP